MVDTEDYLSIVSMWNEKIQIEDDFLTNIPIQKKLTKQTSNEGMSIYKKYDSSNSELVSNFLKVNRISIYMYLHLCIFIMFQYMCSTPLEQTKMVIRGIHSNRFLPQSETIVGCFY